MISDLLNWFDKNQRNLPWRHTKDPYAIWVSEVMLQQTQVATVIPYWLKWMERFPNVRALAEADEQSVLASWQGLGYYRRCRMLQAGAKHVIQSGIPDGVEGWLLVPGVGRYTAGAIASIAQGMSEPLVDGNVGRVYSRLRGDDSNYEQLLKNAWVWAAKQVPTERPGDWNQALMELGATVCTPTKPDCGNCPVASHCVARLTNRTTILPTPKERAQPRRLQETLLVLLHEGKIALQIAPAGGWWESMWTLPKFESQLSLESMFPEFWIENLGTFKYSVTQHRIEASVVLIRLTEPLIDWQFFTPNEVNQLPIPSPHRKALKHLQIHGIC